MTGYSINFTEAYQIACSRDDALKHLLGYSVVFIAPLVFGIEECMGWAGMTFAVFFFLMPFTRSIFGDIDKAWESPPYSEVQVKLLHHLPVLTMLAYVACLSTAPDAFAREWDGRHQIGFWALSLWTLLLFGSCVAHALVHSRSLWHRRLGQLMSGAIGYPMLYAEHIGHHLRCGVDEVPEWAKRDESIYGFVFRRMVWVVRCTFKHHQHAKHDPRQSLATLRWSWFLKSAALDVPVALLGTASTAFAFDLIAGHHGLFVYLLCAASSGIGIQAIGYLQHWGLGDSELPEHRRGNWGWEDLCRIQVWLTMGLSLHQAHHESPSLSYFRLEPVRGAPKPPAGYVIMIFAAMVPPFWKWWMGRVLDRWIASPDHSSTAGRGIICLKI